MTRIRVAEIGRRACLALLATVVVGLASAGSASALEQKLVAIDGGADDGLGGSAAIDGDTAVVGAPGANSNRGAVYVFERTGNTWQQTAKLTASDGAAGDLLGSSVAIDGDTIVAGAPTDDVDPAKFDEGSVYTFARDGAATRSETAKLTAGTGESGDLLGISVAIDGDTIVAGAVWDDVDPAKFDEGSVYTFARTGAAARTETASLIASDGENDFTLGGSVAIEGDTILAGAPGTALDGDEGAGAAYTFARTGASPRPETAKLIASDSGPGEGFGGAVAIDGDRLVVGARGDTIGLDSGRGSAYTFARTGPPLRLELAKMTASDGAENDLFGSSVAIEGDTILAGAPGVPIPAPQQGSAYRFARTGGSEIGKLTRSDAANDSFGASVAIDGGTILAGAPSDTVGANASQGSATVLYAGIAPPSPAPAVAQPPAETGERAKALKKCKKKAKKKAKKKNATKKKTKKALKRCKRRARKLPL